MMKMHKADIAIRQIDTAIELFLEGRDYLSVVTLAGAGEEIIGNLLRRDGQKNMVGHLLDLDKELSNGGREFDVVNQEINGFKNSLKHATKSDEDIVDIPDTREHAIAMLTRAMTNYALLTNNLSPKMLEFHEWLLQKRPELFDKR